MTEASPCRLTRSEALVVAVKEYRGPASAVGEAFDYLLRWAEVHNVERWGPLVGVYEDAEHPDDRVVSGEAWMPVPPDLRTMECGDPEVGIKEAPAEPVASCEHRGFPADLGASMGRLVAWMREQGLERSGPVHRQVYREAPKGAPGDWLIEIHVPVVRPAAVRGASEVRQS